MGGAVPRPTILQTRKLGAGARSSSAQVSGADPVGTRRRTPYDRRVNVFRRHAVSESGPADAPTLLFAHGFGCDQGMWQAAASRFPDYHTVLFDLVGFGDSDLGAYEPDRYRTLDGHAADVLELCRALDRTDIVFIGHSVSAMIGVLVVNQAPELFDGLVMVGPSPCYLEDGDYHGGFTRADIDQMLDGVEADFFAWSATMAPVIAGNPDRPDYGQTLTATFCRSDPDAARQFARATFLSDNRRDLRDVRVPTLIMQCAEDPIAPTAVGEYVHSQIPDSRIVYLEARGHCPNLTAPDETAREIRAFLT